MRACACGLFSQASCLAALDEYMAASHFGQISDVSRVVLLFALRFPLMLAQPSDNSKIATSNPTSAATTATATVTGHPHARGNRRGPLEGAP